MPPPAYDGTLRALTSEGGLSLVLESRHLALESRRSRVAIDLESPFSVILSHSEAAPGHSTLHLEVRQRAEHRWVRIGVASRTRSFAAPVTSTPYLARQQPLIAEADMLALLALLRGAMLLNGHEGWGGESLTQPDNTEKAAPRHLSAQAFRPRARYVIAEGPQSWTCRQPLMGNGTWLWGLGMLSAILLFFVTWHGAAMWATGADALNLWRAGSGALAAVLSLAFWRAAGRAAKVEIGPHSLRLQRPLALWRPAIEVPRPEITQLYSLERAKHFQPTAADFSVRMILTNGRRLDLFTGLPAPEDALFLEKTMEKHLGLLDLPVAGEVAQGEPLDLR